MRSLRLEHSPLGLLNPVWGTHSAPCCGGALRAAFVLEGRWDGLVCSLCELLGATRSCAYRVFTPQSLPPSTPRISYQWKVKTFFTIWPKQCEASLRCRNFPVYVFEGLCGGCVGRSTLESAALLRVGVETESPTGLLRVETQGAAGTAEGVRTDRLMGICAVRWLCRALNNQIPSDHSASWIAYDKITGFSPTLFNLHLEKNWKWHGKVRPINMNNCSLFASTVLQHAVW